MRGSLDPLVSEILVLQENDPVGRPRDSEDGDGEYGEENQHGFHKREYSTIDSSLSSVGQNVPKSFFNPGGAPRAPLFLSDLYDRLTVR